MMQRCTRQNTRHLQGSPIARTVRMVYVDRLKYCDSHDVLRLNVMFGQNNTALPGCRDLQAAACIAARMLFCSEVLL